jgi:hypothetical protein
MTSAPNYAETLEKFRARNGDGPGKGREAEGLLIKPNRFTITKKSNFVSVSIARRTT